MAVCRRRAVGGGEGKERVVGLQTERGGCKKESDKKRGERRKKVREQKREGQKDNEKEKE